MQASALPLAHAGTFIVQRKDQEHLSCHVRNLSYVFRLALKILSGGLSSEENDKQTYHDIALPSMTHHSYFPCYNKVALLYFVTPSTKHACMLKL